MRKCVFEIGSVTHAMKAQKVLSDASIPSKIVKIKNDKRGRGCVYGVETECIYVRVASERFDTHGINYVNVT